MTAGDFASERLFLKLCQIDMKWRCNDHGGISSVTRHSLTYRHALRAPTPHDSTESASCNPRCKDSPFFLLCTNSFTQFLVVIPELPISLAQQHDQVLVYRGPLHGHWVRTRSVMPFLSLAVLSPGRATGCEAFYSSGQELFFDFRPFPAATAYRLDRRTTFAKLCTKDIETWCL